MTLMLPPFTALIQKSSIDDASIKSKVNFKPASIQSTIPPTSLANETKSTCFQNVATETILPSDRDAVESTHLTINTFSILIIFLIIALVLFNIYLFAELYAYKQKELDGITLSKMQLNNLISSRWV